LVDFIVLMRSKDLRHCDLSRKIGREGKPKSSSIKMPAWKGLSLLPRLLKIALQILPFALDTRYIDE
jgi:hypothetical protein